MPDLITTFIPIPGDVRSVRFLWVKRVLGLGPRSSLKPDKKYPFPDDYTKPGIALTLKRLEQFNDYEGRLIVEWNRPHRPYDQWFDPKRPMRVLELHAIGSFDRFPGYAKVFLTFDQLRTIILHPNVNRDWHAALEAVKGIYLVTNTFDGTAYVGKASGISGFLSRWRDYVKTGGHGGNVELRKMIAKDANYVKGLRWSILHVLPNDSTDKEIDELERLAKNKLGTRIVPLNKN